MNFLFHPIILIFLVAGIAGLSVGAERPNLLIILTDDIGETTNLQAEHPEKVSDLQLQLDAIRSES